MFPRKGNLIRGMRAAIVSSPDFAGPVNAMATSCNGDGENPALRAQAGSSQRAVACYLLRLERAIWRKSKIKGSKAMATITREGTAASAIRSSLARL
jgi:hypothetical protein